MKASWFTSQVNNVSKSSALVTRVWWSLVFVLLIGMPLSARTPDAKQGSNAMPSSGSQTTTAGGNYVGSETCKTCHEAIYTKSFVDTPHGALLKENQHGCEDCHGPGGEHVAGGGDVSKIIRFSKLSVSEASGRCLSCHQSNHENTDFSRSVHMASGVGCLNCHSPHHATERASLLINKQPGLCYGCHAQQKAEFGLPYHHRVNEGLITCDDCHNPHGSFNDKQLRTADGGMQVCAKCHTEKTGPFVFEHIPVRQEGCGSCHTPHGSTNPRQLRVSQVNILCLQCHSPIANRTTPGIPTFHTQSTKYQACTLCHTQIHGSNFDEFFFK